MALISKALAAGCALGASLGISTVAWAMDYARQNYILHCAGCHQLDGRGSAANDVPTLHHIPGMFVAIARGREFLAQVPGIIYSPLSNAEVAEILNWMLGEYNKDELPKDFAPYTAAEVGKYRAIRPASIMGVRAQVLTELTQRGITVDYQAH